MHQILEDVSLCSGNRVVFAYSSGSEPAFLYNGGGERVFFEAELEAELKAELEVELMLSNGGKDLDVCLSMWNMYKIEQTK